MREHELLEREWAAKLQLHDVVACSSGTAALHLALEALDLPPGSGVLVPNYSMYAAARAVVLAGHQPVFVPCGEDLLMSPGWAKQLKTSWVRAIIAVHTYGRRCDVEALAKLDLPIIEDHAESHGLLPGISSVALCWSFYANKVVFGEEGGAVAFKDWQLHSKARKLRSLGFESEQDYWHIPRGHNYRMSESHARLIRASLLDMELWLERRREQVQLLDSMCPAEWRAAGRPVPWVYDFRVPGLTEEQQRAAITAMRAAGIAARYGFRPCSFQPEFNGGMRKALDVGSQDCLAAKEVIYLPLGQNWPTADVCVAFDAVHAQASKTPSSPERGAAS